MNIKNNNDKYGWLGVTLAMCILFSLLPHLFKLPIVFSGYVFLLMAWFILHSLKNIRMPNKFIRLIFFVSGLSLIVIHFGIHFSQRMSISLLAIMLSLKLFEVKGIHDRRNITLIIYLCFFLIGSHFLSSQSIFIMVYNIVLALCLFTLLAAYNRRPLQLQPLKVLIRSPISIFVQAIPLTIIFFLFFPRISSPLWSLPDDYRESKTGLSDTMHPGRITQLSDDNSVAFRVVFHNTIPSNQNLYWRGPVLSKTDGYLWSRYINQDIKIEKNEIDYIDNEIDYTITLEPQEQRWLFALDMPSTVPKDSYFSHDYQIMTKKNLTQVKRYKLTSFTNYKIPAISDTELSKTLQLPDNANPRTLMLGRKWRNQNSSPEDIVQQALTFFKRESFFYTRQPPVMLDDPIDQFLFEFKEGFCEHYATAFVYLMRAAGIPARIVTGYQGIEKNDVGNYYIVRQSNAHAWAEVWLSDKGWWRVDPTSAVPPERIKPDILNRQARQLAFMNLNLPKFKLQNDSMLLESWSLLKDNIDSVRYFWNEWVVGFDLLKQQNMMKLIGLSANIKYLVSSMVVIGLITILMLSLYWYFLAKQIKDPIKRNYQYFIRKLEKSGLIIPSNMGPLELQRLAIQHFPLHKLIIIEIISHYIALRYGRNDENTKIEYLTKKIQQFNI